MYTYRRPISPMVEQQYTDDQCLVRMVDEVDTIKSFDHTSIYRSKVFTEAMDTYFDIEDKMTRNVLLSVNEADQNVVMKSLSDKLYKHIVDKVDDIDFGTIPLSKGDITKIDNYEQLCDCINIMGDILEQYRQDITPVQTVSLALQNMIDRTDLFTKAYKLNVEMPIIIYNTITMAIVSSVSFLISSCIEFIKLGSDQGYDIALNSVGLKKTRECVLFKDLEKFNNICNNGDFDKAMEYVISKNAEKNFTGFGMAFGVSSVAIILGILISIIPIIRELIFIFYWSRVKVSDYFEAQANLLIMNAYNIENNLSTEDKSKKEIANKQRKIADMFKKISNTIKVNVVTGEKKAQNEINKLDSKKYKQDEVLDTIPDSSNSVLF